MRPNSWITVANHQHAWRGYGGLSGREELLARYQDSLTLDERELWFGDAHLKEDVVEALCAVDAADRGEGEERIDVLMRQRVPLSPLAQGVVADWISRRSAKTFPVYTVSLRTPPLSSTWKADKADFVAWWRVFGDRP